MKIIWTPVCFKAFEFNVKFLNSSINPSRVYIEPFKIGKYLAGMFGLKLPPSHSGD